MSPLMILVIRRAIPSIQISSLARMDSILPHQPDGPGAAPLLLLSSICFISAGDGTLIEGAVLGKGGNDAVIGRGGCNAHSLSCTSGSLVLSNVASDANVCAALRIWLSHRSVFALVTALSSFVNNGLNA